MTFCIQCECGHRFPVNLCKSFLHSDSRLLYCPACKTPYIFRKKLPPLSLWQRLRKAFKDLWNWLKKHDVTGYFRRRREKQEMKKRIEELAEFFLKPRVVYNA